MKYKKTILAIAFFSTPLCAENDREVQQEIQRLQHQSHRLQVRLDQLQEKMLSNKKLNTTQAKTAKGHRKPLSKIKKSRESEFHSSQLSVHAPEENPESIGFYPTALVAENQVVTYIAGTPVVSSPYLGDRPAFDGSDYIVNISSINRDIRLMQQRRRLYRAYENIGYPVPQMPIIALSGKLEPVGMVNNPFRSSNTQADLTLGTSELDVAATLNQNVEGFISIAYDESPPEVGPRIDNSAFSLNLGFVNVGNLDKTPFYFTAGQLYVPFGKYSSAMVSSPVTMNLARTKTRPFILGYKSQGNTGPFAATYIYRSDTTLGKAGVGGFNLGYVFEADSVNGEMGAGYISSIDDAAGMQSTGSMPATTFGGFGSFSNGNEAVRKTQAMNAHANVGYDRFNFAAEWVGAIQSFRAQDLSVNGRGARPEAGQFEAGMTFRAFDRPASIGIGYQWSKDALALNLPKQRMSGVFNISIWKDTVESVEYRHDIDYASGQFSNGAAPTGLVNQPTWGAGKSSDTLSAQIGVYF